MKNIVFIALIGLVLSSCNDSSKKTTPSAEPAVSLKTADTSRNNLAVVASKKDSVKKSTVKQKVRTKKKRKDQKIATFKKTSGNKKVSPDTACYLITFTGIHHMFQPPNRLEHDDSVHSHTLAFSIAC